MRKYYCFACKKTVPRTYKALRVRSFCSATGKSGWIWRRSL